MNDFLKETLESARQVSGDILDNVEKALGRFLDSAEQLVDELDLEEPTIESLEADVAALEDELAEARTALKLLLDGEVSRSFYVSDVQRQTLDSYIVDTWWEGERNKDLRLVVRQRRV